MCVRPCVWIEHPLRQKWLCSQKNTFYWRGILVHVYHVIVLQTLITYIHMCNCYFKTYDIAKLNAKIRRKQKLIKYCNCFLDFSCL